MLLLKNNREITEEQTCIFTSKNGKMEVEK